MTLSIMLVFPPNALNGVNIMECRLYVHLSNPRHRVASSTCVTSLLAFVAALEIETWRLRWRHGSITLINGVCRSSSVRMMILICKRNWTRCNLTLHKEKLTLVANRICRKRPLIRTLRRRSRRNLLTLLVLNHARRKLVTNVNIKNARAKLMFKQI